MKSKIYKSFILLLCFMLFVQIATIAQTDLDKLEQEFQNTQNNLDRLRLTHQIIQKSEENNPKLALEYAEEAKKIIESSGFDNKEAEIEAHQDIALAYFVNQEQEKAENYANQSIQLSEKEEDKIGISKGLNLLSLFYRKKDKNRSYILAKQALFVAKDISNGAGILEASNNILEVSNNDPDLPNYIQEARKGEKQVANPKLLADFYKNVGSFEIQKGNFSQAENDYKKALDNSLLTENKKRIVENLNLFGKVKTEYLDKETEGLEYLFQAYILAQEYDFEENGKRLYEAMQNISSAYANLEAENNGEKAEQYRLLKNSYAKRSKILEGVNYDITAYIKKTYNSKLQEASPIVTNPNLSNEIERQKRLINNLRESNNILEIASKKARIQQEEDSILILKKNKTIKELRADLEDKTLENNSLRTAQKNHENELKNTKNYWFFWLILALVLGIALASFLLYLNRKNQSEVDKQKTTLNNYKEHINRQEKEIRENKDKINLKQEQLVSANAKLDDAQQHNIAIQQVLVEELQTPIAKIVDETIEEQEINRLLIHQSGKQMLNLLTSIEEVQKYEKVEIRLFKESNSIYKVAKQAIKDNEALIKERGIEVENNIKPYLYAEFDQEIITKVFHNYLANSLKYTEIGGKIGFNAKPMLQDDTHFIEIKVTDNGQIIPKNLQNQTYQKFSVEEARPSAMGLVFNKLMIEEHGGKVSVESGEDKGTSFFFTLPKSNSMEDIDLEEVFENNKNESKPINTIETVNVSENNPTDQVISQLDTDSKRLLKPFLKKLADLEYFETSSINAVLRDIHFEGNASIQKWKNAMNNAIYYVDEEKYRRLTQI